MQKGKKRQTTRIDNTQLLKALKEMMASLEAMQAETKTDLEIRMAERGRGTEACASTAQPPKFDGTTSWAMFWRQFETVVEHNCLARQEKSTYLITTLKGRAADVLHGIPTNAT
jgi:hypothetical protein